MKGMVVVIVLLSAFGSVVLTVLSVCAALAQKAL